MPTLKTINTTNNKRFVILTAMSYSSGWVATPSNQTFKHSEALAIMNDLESRGVTKFLLVDTETGYVEVGGNLLTRIGLNTEVPTD